MVEISALTLFLAVVGSFYIVQILLAFQFLVAERWKEFLIGLIPIYGVYYISQNL